MDVRITDEIWADMATVRLASDEVAVTIAPDVGGRVISMIDRRSGREWLTSAPPPDPDLRARWASEAAVFDGRVSFGWDECLPTVAPCPDPLDADAAPLRDHGDQWGREAPTSAVDDGSALLTRWPTTRWDYSFERRISLADDAAVHADYQLTAGDRAIPVLWSMHPCLRLEPGSTLHVDGVDDVLATWSSGMGLPQSRVAWPITDAGRDLSRVLTDDVSAAKLYAQRPGRARAETPDGSALDVEWDRAFAPDLGIWLSYGAWPSTDAAVEQVALEPTTSGHDDLASALRDDAARRLEPGETASWRVSLRLSASQQRA